LDSEEITIDNFLVQKQGGQNSIEITKSSFTWGIKQVKDEENKDKEESSKKISLDSLAVLKDFELKVKKGEFVCIIGDVGSGKSSILSTIIGDLIPMNEKQYDLLKESCIDGSLEEKTVEKLLSSILSEINENPCDVISLLGEIAYVQQQPWI
jgi:ABC-type uncharacterized transport system ATPase component